MVSPVSAMQRLFWLHFNLNWHGAVLSYTTILLWVKNFQEIGNIIEENAT